MSRLICFALALLPLSLVTACSSETGLLVEIERGGSVQGEIDTLVLYAGVRNVDRADMQNYRDIDPARESMADVAGRDLAASPYRLLLRRSPDLPERGIMVAALAFSGGPDGTPVAFGRLSDPVEFKSGKVLKWTITLGALPADWQVTDTGCLVWREQDQTFEIGRPGDLDCDGDPDDEDCAPEDPSIFHGQIEDCDNGIDDNCDGNDAEQVDNDGDGYTSCAGEESDCDDTRAEVHPGAEEICDGLDNDCSGTCDDGFDADGDDFTTCGTKILGATCDDGFWPDCDDDPERNPGVEEQCDAIDHDCDGNCVNGFDGDGDGWAADCPVFSDADGKCVAGDTADCADGDPDVHPNQPEVCDGKGDTNCDGEKMASEVKCYANNPEGELLCYQGTRTCDDSEGGAGWTGECQPDVKADNLAPQGLCDAYDGCTSAPDPLQCTYQNAQAIENACGVTYIAANDSALCGQPLSFLLPTQGQQAECSWRLVGGTEQDAYLAGFGDPDVTLTATSATCDGSFYIEQPTSSPPQDDDLVLWLNTTDGDQVYVIHVQPHEVAECADVTLECLPAPL